MLEPLRHFTLVADHRTFTAAARHAGVSQPALTASIQRLEAQMGASLLVRGPSGATLTAAGAALLPSARAALAAVDEGKRAVAETMGLARGTVRLGAGATVCTYYLPRTLATFRARYPGVQITMRESNASELLDALEAGELDLVVVAGVHGPEERRPRNRKPSEDLARAARAGFAREKWIDDELVLIAAPSVDPKAAPLVAFSRGGNTRAFTDRFFPEVPIAMELSSIETVKANVAAGLGIALVSRRAITRDLEARHLAIVPTDRTPILRRLHIIHRGRDRLPPAARELHKMMRRPG